MDEQHALEAITALGHQARLRVFRALVGAGPEGLTPSDLAPRFDLAPSTLSFHLKELSNAGLVSVHREGRQLFYRPNLGHMDALLSYLVDHCCQSQPCAPAVPRRRAAACRPDQSDSTTGRKARQARQA